MKIIMFDVDDTLWLSDGPVQLIDLLRLKERGHVLGLNGNWALVCQRFRGWDRLFSLIGPMTMTKETFLNHIKTYIDAEEYIMVGNEVDREAAYLSGWRFIRENMFYEANIIGQG